MYAWHIYTYRSANAECSIRFLSFSYLNNCLSRYFLLRSSIRGTKKMTEVPSTLPSSIVYTDQLELLPGILLSESQSRLCSGFQWQLRKSEMVLFILLEMTIAVMAKHTVTLIPPGSVIWLCSVNWMSVWYVWMLLLIDLQMTLLGAMAAVVDWEPWLLYWAWSHGCCIYWTSCSMMYSTLLILVSLYQQIFGVFFCIILFES